MRPDMSPAERDRPFDLVELARRLENVVRSGTVAEVDLEDGRVRAAYGVAADGDPLVSGWLPWLTMRAGEDRTWWAPSVGELVVLLSPDGDLRRAFALPAGYRTRFPAPSQSGAVNLSRYRDDAEVAYDAEGHVLRHRAQDGAVMSYDATAHHLAVTLPAAATTALDSKGGVTITGNVTVLGNVVVQQRDGVPGNLTVEHGDILATAGEVSDEDGSMEEMRGFYNSHTHRFVGAPSGTLSRTGDADPYMI